MSVKADFLEAIRKTPDGIDGFLATAIPTLTATTLPTDTDSAILVQGILAHNLNTILCLYSGLTPIELLLRIGQHSNVSEAILLSGLEFIGDSQAQKEFTIKEPVEDYEYAPGDIRVIVKAKTKPLTVKASTDNPETPETQITDLKSTDGEMFYGYIRLDSNGDYTTVVTVTFDDNDQTTKTAPVHFSVTDDGDTTADLAEFNLAAQKVIADADGLIGGDMISKISGAIESAVSTLIKVVNAL